MDDVVVGHARGGICLALNGIPPLLLATTHHGHFDCDVQDTSDN